MNSRDSIEHDTRELAMRNGRRVGQPGHDVALRYLTGRLKDIGLAPFQGDGFELPYRYSHPATGKPTEFVNLAAVIHGTDAGKAPILIGAHYDSVIDAPCADDNATAVAVVLATAERFIRTPLTRDIIIAIFDAEEPPFFCTSAMGSTRFYEDHCRDIRFACAIIMDLIGHDVEIGNWAVDKLLPNIKEVLFVLGAESDPTLPGVVESAAERISHLRVFPSLNSYVGDMSDHHAFRLGGQPFLFLSCGQGRYYHRSGDDMNWINLDKVQRVHELVVEFVAAIDKSEPAAVAQPGDTAEYEIRMIEKAVPLLPMLLGRLGLPALKSRKDLDRLAAMLTRTMMV